MPSRNITLVVRAMGASTAARQLNAVSSSLGGIDRRGRGATRSINSASSALSAFNKTAQYATVRAAAGVASVGVAAAVTGVKFNAMMERQVTAFTGFLGSAQKAKDYVDSLYKIAAETPFEFEDVLKGTRTLVAYGMSAEKARSTFVGLGDAIAATGGGQDEIRRATIGLGQIQATGVLHAQDMNQLVQAGVLNVDKVAKTLGMTTKEFFAARKEGEITSQEFMNATLQMWRDDPMYSGAAEKQAKTFQGQLQKLRDYTKQTLGIITEPLFLALRNDVLPAFASATQDMNVIWKNTKLSLDDKLTLSRDVLHKRLDPIADEFAAWWRSNRVGGKISAAFEDLLTYVGNQMPGAVAKLATIFWDSFWGMGTKGKAITAAFVLTKLGLTRKLLTGAGGLLWGALWGGKGKGGGTTGGIMNVTAGVVNVVEGLPGGGGGAAKKTRQGPLQRAVRKVAPFAGALGSRLAPLGALAPSAIVGAYAWNQAQQHRNLPTRGAAHARREQEAFPTGQFPMRRRDVLARQQAQTQAQSMSPFGLPEGLNLRGLQSGGTTSQGGAYTVGERGRENLYLPGGSTVVPGQQPVHITTHLTVDGKVLATAVNRAVIKQASVR